MCCGGYRRAISHNFFEVDVCFCNFRYLLDYAKTNKNTSKITHKVPLSLSAPKRYTGSMSFIAKATEAPKPKTQNAWLASLLLAGFFVILAVGQLFTFENLPSSLEAMWLPDGQVVSTIVAASIVTLEVLALPFLLGLRLSVAMRVFSMVCGWLVIAAWLAISLGNSIVDSGVNSAFLGATVVLPAGWWSVLFCVALGVLATWAAWGMWPTGHRKK